VRACGLFGVLSLVASLTISDHTPYFVCIATGFIVTSILVLWRLYRHL